MHGQRKVGNPWARHLHHCIGFREQRKHLWKVPLQQKGWKTLLYWKQNMPINRLTMAVWRIPRQSDVVPQKLPDSVILVIVNRSLIHRTALSCDLLAQKCESLLLMKGHKCSCAMLVTVMCFCRDRSLRNSVLPLVGCLSSLPIFGDGPPSACVGEVTTAISFKQISRGIDSPFVLASLL